MHAGIFGVSETKSQREIFLCVCGMTELKWGEEYILTWRAETHMQWWKLHLREETQEEEKLEWTL